MHYQNGREAKLGDPVVGTGFNLHGAVVGVVVELFCDGRIRVATPRNSSPTAEGVALVVNNGSLTFLLTEYGAAKDFLHAEDAIKPTRYHQVSEPTTKTS